MQLFKIKLKLSLKSTLKVLSNWRYSLIASLIALLFVQFLYWMMNWSLFWFFLTNKNLSPLDKIDVFSGVISSYLSSMPLWQAAVIVLLSVIQGVVITVLIYTIKAQNEIDKKAFSGSTIASIIAMFSVGCVSCGTSIVAPIIGLFVSGASASVSESINKYAVVFSLLVAIYAFYAVGLAASNIHAKGKAKSSDNETIEDLK